MPKKVGTITFAVTLIVLAGRANGDRWRGREAPIAILRQGESRLAY